MPITVISVCGRVRHIRPLPSDSTTTSVPVSATPKLAPLTATLAERNFRRKCSRAAIASTRGSSVSSPASGISRMKMSRISARLRWIAGTRMWLGQSWPSWTISSARSVSIAVMPSALQMLVEADLLGRHRFDLDHLVGPVSWIRPVTMRLASSASRAQCTTPPRADHIALELLEQLRQAGHHVLLKRTARKPQLFPVGAFTHRRKPFGSNGAGRVADVMAHLRVSQRTASRTRKRLCSPRRLPIPGVPRNVVIVRPLPLHARSLLWQQGFQPDEPCAPLI